MPVEIDAGRQLDLTRYLVEEVAPIRVDDVCTFRLERLKRVREPGAGNDQVEITIRTESWTAVGECGENRTFHDEERNSRAEQTFPDAAKSSAHDQVASALLAL